MKIFAKSDTGVVRESNQDYYATGQFGDLYAYAVVCDGMGGYNGGNIASKLAVNTILEHLQKSLQGALTDEMIRKCMNEAIVLANSNIYKMAKSNEFLKGMGTTVVLAITADEHVYIAHVGDSRAYLSDAGDFVQITTDHSIVQEMVENGELTFEEAREHPNKNIITRALGVKEDVEIDFNKSDFEKGRILIICTDGLSNYLLGNSFKDLIQDLAIDAYAERLVDFAMTSGGADNITVVVIANS